MRLLHAGRSTNISGLLCWQVQQLQAYQLLRGASAKMVKPFRLLASRSSQFPAKCRPPRGHSLFAAGTKKRTSSSIDKKLGQYINFLARQCTYTCPLRLGRGQVGDLKSGEFEVLGWITWDPRPNPISIASTLHPKSPLLGLQDPAMGVLSLLRQVRGTRLDRGERPASTEVPILGKECFFQPLFCNVGGLPRFLSFPNSRTLAANTVLLVT